jgi:hypothetical protein
LMASGPSFVGKGGAFGLKPNVGDALELRTSSYVFKSKRELIKR